jgi:uncharacterized protein YukE
MEEIAMGLIQADVERLRAAIAVLKQGHSEIEREFKQVSQAMNSLQNRSWAGRHRQQAETVWDQLQGRFSPLLDGLQQLTNRTERFTDAFEAAGSRFDSGKGIVPTSPDVRAPERGIAGSINSGSNGTDSPTNSPSESASPSSSLPPVLNQRVRLRNGAEVLPIELDGRTPVAGMDSIYGKPGQLPLQAPITSDSNNRHPQLYEAVIEQFGVEGNPRYTPDNYTYCNTFAGDVMRAMGVPLPMKMELGVAANDRATVGTQHLYNWLNSPQARERGWREIDPNKPEDLRLLKQHVNAGKPALAADPGHVVVVRPGQTAENVGDIRIAQAGARNINDIRLRDAGLGGPFRPRYYIHD